MTKKNKEITKNDKEIKWNTKEKRNTKAWQWITKNINEAKQDMLKKYQKIPMDTKNKETQWMTKKYNLKRTNHNEFQGTTKNDNEIKRDDKGNTKKHPEMQWRQWNYKEMNLCTVWTH